MASCPGCGIDVTKAGLCPECEAQKQKKQKQSQGRTTSLKPIQIILIIAGFLIVLSGAAIIGVSISTNNSSKSNGEQVTNSGDNKEITASVSANAATQTKEIKPEFDIQSLPPGPPIDDKAAYLAYMKQYTRHEEKYLLQRWDRAQAARKHYTPPDLTIERVIQGFLRTPREFFCREWNLSRAYESAYLSIRYGQTISGPYIVCRMTNAINPQPNHKVLEIGTGSGYQSSFLAELCNFVYTIEIVNELYQETDVIYKEKEGDYPQYKNVKRKRADGYYGWEEYAPFDRIIVTCGIDHIPPALLKQLAPNGIMVIPVGPPSGQQILKITKQVDATGFVTLNREDIYAGTGLKGDVFVPFTADTGDSHSKVRDKVQE
jgi:protein-L-isoaspartate(D-aspartate) O-methyltransferase